MQLGIVMHSLAILLISIMLRKMAGDSSVGPPFNEDVSSTYHSFQAIMMSQRCIMKVPVKCLGLQEVDMDMMKEPLV